MNPSVLKISWFLSCVRLLTRNQAGALYNGAFQPSEFMGRSIYKRSIKTLRVRLDKQKHLRMLGKPQEISWSSYMRYERKH
ncbi:hypothetical protein SADUNF_Sadunf19G0050800 [Salix dunnii]|uniref:Uncharacterized protein n=1 Tax=Salix dunnii TaxID=1413687 RepID=A0A835J1V2_9ROSI|nr:hypothetical protein SADUNF_Sadunf19G0050800 [Salix dunnii]